MTADYTLDDLKALSLEEFSSLVNQLGRGRVKDPEKVAKSISKAIRGRYRMSKTHEKCVDRAVGVLVRQMRSFAKSIREIDEAIEDIAETPPEYQCLTSGPGLGTVSA